MYPFSGIFAIGINTASSQRINNNTNVQIIWPLESTPAALSHADNSEIKLHYLNWFRIFFLGKLSVFIYFIVIGPADMYRSERPSYFKLFGEFNNLPWTVVRDAREKFCRNLIMWNASHYDPLSDHWSNLPESVQGLVRKSAFYGRADEVEKIFL